MINKTKTVLEKIFRQREKIKAREFEIFKREIIEATGGKKIIISFTEEQLNKLMTDCYQDGGKAQIEEDNKRFLGMIDERISQCHATSASGERTQAFIDIKQELRNKVNKK